MLRVVIDESAKCGDEATVILPAAFSKVVNLSFCFFVIKFDSSVRGLKFKNKY
jgi:hypothetical protein